MRSERAVIGLVGAVQFVNTLDFMMVMPLGPDFAKSLAMPLDQLGIVAGAYTLSAGVAGLLLSPILDKVDRRIALFVCMMGLAIGTALGGLATDFRSLVATRVVAGAFGGPATSVALAIVADVIPAERRGRAMGSVMGAFSIASVLGVPAGLFLAEITGWRGPFFAVAGAGVVISAAATSLLPPLRGHISQASKGGPFRGCFGNGWCGLPWPPRRQSRSPRSSPSLTWARSSSIIFSGLAYTSVSSTWRVARFPSSDSAFSAA